MTKALVAINEATYGGVYYSADIDFVTPGDPTWARRSTTGLDNLLIKAMGVHPAGPYSANNCYVQLDNDNLYRWNGTSWTEIMTTADARTLVGVGSGSLGIFAVDPSTTGTLVIPFELGGYCSLLRSVDNGDNWTVLTVTNYGGITGTPTCSAYGQYLIYSIRIIRALGLLQNKRDTNPMKKHGNIPLLTVEYKYRTSLEGRST